MFVAKQPTGDNAANPGPRVPQAMPISAAGPDSAVSAGASCRRRLFMKQTPPPAYTIALPITVAEQQPENARRWEVVRLARILYRCHFAKSRQAGTYKDSKAVAERQWPALLIAEQELWVQEAERQLATKSAEVQAAMLAQERNTAAALELLQDERANGALLTWNGPWLQDKLADIVQRWSTDSLRMIEEVLKVAEVQQLFDEFWNTLAKCKAEQEWEHMSCSLEMSVHAEQPGRVHLHCMTTFPVGRPKCGPICRRTLFQDRVCSHWSPCMGRKGPRGRDRSLREGHYYLQAPKIGTVLRRTDWEKHVQWKVDAQFVKSLWQLRKMSDDDAKYELVDTRDKVHFHLQDVEKSLAAAYRVNCDRTWKTVQRCWESKPFKPATRAEVSWLCQYTKLLDDPALAHTAAVSACTDVARLGTTVGRRFKFLVYDGPTRLGKTERACHWWGQTETLVLNCQGITTPNLREWMSGAYRGIIFDEADWRLVSENRAMFQASPRPVTLSQSQCNESCYSVMLYMTPLMICSNDFWKGCQDWDSWRWIQGNCEYVLINEPTWEC